MILYGKSLSLVPKVSDRIFLDIGRPEYLLNGTVEISAFGGPIVEFSSLNGELAVSNGGGGGQRSS
jgi:hypothetical protein